MDKQFSIILPVYNVADYLERSLTSVLAQSGHDYEVILVDDGSTDRSGSLCDEWAEKDERIRVIHKENGGLASARNAGLDAAEGRYALLIDSDDYIESDSLDVIRKAIAVSNADLIRFDLAIHHGQKMTECRNSYAPGLYSGSDLHDKLLVSIMMNSGSYLLSSCIHVYRMEFLKKNNLRFISERLVLSEDFLFMLCTLYCVESLYITDRVLYHYDMREGSLTHSPRPRMFERYTELHRCLIRFMQEHHAPDLYIRLANKYYAYDLFYLTIVNREYSVYPGHTWNDARKKVREMLKEKELRSSARNMDIYGLPLKEKVKCMFIRYGIEAGLAFAFKKRKKGIE